MDTEGDAFGSIRDPARGIGGMFVQSARVIEQHRQNPDAEISIDGQDRMLEIAHFCRVDLAVRLMAAVLLE